MKISRTLPVLSSLFLVCVSVCSGQNKDAELRQQLTGKWALEEFHPNGNRSATGAWVITGNGGFRRDVTNASSVFVRWVTLEGTMRVKDGFLIETITNVVAHGRPESEQNKLPDGGLAIRTKIIRVNDRELVLDVATNEVLAKMVYRRVAK